MFHGLSFALPRAILNRALHRKRSFHCTRNSHGARNSHRKARTKRSFARAVRDCPIPQAHQEYLQVRRAEGIRDSTLRMYAGALDLWERWCASQNVAHVSQITTKHAEEYLLSLQKAKLSERTIRNRAIVIKGALKFAHKQGYLPSERLYGWKIPRMGRASVYMPSLSEVGVILSAIPEHWSVAENPHSRFRNAAARTFFSRRDQAIVGVQVSTGLRISETFGLRLQDFSSDHGTLTVTQSKSGKPRAVPVGESLARLLADWLRVRPQASETDFLFVTEYGGQLHRDSWGHQFQRYLTFARGQGHALPRITLHSLRHLAGTAMAEHDLYHASLMLGHSSIQITADNYLHARAESIRATHTAADPLAHILSRGRKAPEKRRKLV